MLSPWPDFAVRSVTEGLPILSPRFDQSNRIDLTQDFRVAVRGSEVLVFWSDFAPSEAYGLEGQVEFLIGTGRLCGARFLRLSKEEVALFMSHAQHGA
jgi:hypothetical protein